MEIKVNIKHMGKRKKSVEPRTYRLASPPSTVRELIMGFLRQAGKRELPENGYKE